MASASASVGKEEIACVDLGSDDDEEVEEEISSNYKDSYLAETEGLIDFEEVGTDEEYVPAHDPLSLDNEEDDDIVILSDSGENQKGKASDDLVLVDNTNDDDEILPVEVAKIYSQEPQISAVHGHSKTLSCPSRSQNTLQLVFKEPEKPLVITAVSSLQVLECTVGPTRSETPASFLSLDVFRCFYCRLNYFHLDDLIRHRQSIIPAFGPGTHPNKTYNPEVEKPFACGICGKPWDQPRKALACARFGHEPKAIAWAMFRHGCPMCPEDRIRFHSLGAVARHWAIEHWEKPLPQFLLKDAGNDKLPYVKISNVHFERADGPVFLNVDGRNVPLIIENFHCRNRSDNCRVGPHMPVKIPGTDLMSSVQSLVKSQKKPTQKVKSYRCKECLRMVVPQVSPKSRHKCLRNERDGKIIFVCPRCKTRFVDKRTLKLHLMNFCACFSTPTSQTTEDMCPYVCILCTKRFQTFLILKNHRTTAHPEFPFKPENELPFKCGVCGRPSLIEKEAKLCEKFGHDPLTIRNVMFNFRCGECPPLSFGFHSRFSLRKHWEKVHSHLEMPQKLKECSEEDVPLPFVTLTLEQLLICAEKRQRTQYDADALTEYAECEYKLPDKKEVLDLDKVMKNDEEIVILDDETDKAVAPKCESEKPPSLNGKYCDMCKLYFKNIKKHMKVHDTERYRVPAKHKCGGCGRAYRFRNSLICHWRAHPNCKLTPDKGSVIKDEKVIKQDSMHNATDGNSENSLLRSVLSAPAEKENISEEKALLTSEQLEQAFALIGDDFFGESAPVSTGETLTLHYGENSDTKAPASVQTSTEPVIVPPIQLNSKREPIPVVKPEENTLKLDLTEKKIEIGDVFKAKTEINSVLYNEDLVKCLREKKTPKPKQGRKQKFVQRKIVDGPRPIVCTLCRLGYPNQDSFNIHMDQRHGEEYPFKCEHCGKRFNSEYKKRAHIVIHDPNRFKGPPKFACDICGKKYHLESSVSSHRSQKHYGRKFPYKNQGPILQPRPFWSRQRRIKKFSCHKCDRKFAYKNFLQQHLWREHIGKFEIQPDGRKSKVDTMKKEFPSMHACDLCPKVFQFSYLLRNHQRAHTGELPFECSICNRRFRRKIYLRNHTRNIHEKGMKKPELEKPSAEQSKDDCKLEKFEAIDHSKEFKCIVCGVFFQWSSDLRKHRIIKHGNFPTDPEKTKAFGCGVCGKPAIRRSQAMVCALLEHDPAMLLVEMFKHKCSVCPAESFGYHSLVRLRKHWMMEHKDEIMPDELLCLQDEIAETLPSIVADEEKAKDIMEKGAVVPRDHLPLVIEFDLLSPPKSNHPELPLPPPVRIRPTPPIRIKKQRTDLGQSPQENMGEETDSNLNTFGDSDSNSAISINSVMSLVNMEDPFVMPIVKSEVEVEVEDVKPFIHFLTEDQIPECESSSPSQPFYEMEANMPKDIDIDIDSDTGLPQDTGLPPEFRIYRRSPRVLNSKPATDSSSNNKDPSELSKSKNANRKVQKPNGKKSNLSKIKGNDHSTGSLINSNAQKVNGKAQLPNNPRAKPKSKKKLKRKPRKPEISKIEYIKRFSAHDSSPEKEAMPIISVEFAELALTSLQTSSPPPSPEARASAEETEDSPEKEESVSPSQPPGPAILKLLRKANSVGAAIATSSATTSTSTDVAAQQPNSDSKDSSLQPLPPNSSNTVNIHDQVAIRNALSSKNLCIPITRIDADEPNDEVKNTSKTNGVSAFVLQLRNSKRQAPTGTK